MCHYIMVRIEIDNREKKAFENLYSENEEVFTTLPLGDFKLTLDDDNGKSLIVERKSINDLASSIMDGRFKEQKNRLVQYAESGGMIAYIIEGCKSVIDLDNANISSRLNSSALSTCITNVSVRDKIPVFFSLNPSETTNIINLLIEKLPKIYKKQTASCDAPNAIIGKSTVKTGLLREEMSAAMLSQIPGISFSVARSIISNAPSSIPSLFFPWIIGNNTIEDIVTRLKDIKISDKQKLGPKRADNIARYFTSNY